VFSSTLSFIKTFYRIHRMCKNCKIWDNLSTKKSALLKIAFKNFLKSTPIISNYLPSMATFLKKLLMKNKKLYSISIKPTMQPSHYNKINLTLNKIKSNTDKIHKPASSNAPETMKISAMFFLAITRCAEYSAGTITKL
jgi:hypothetical protein